MTAYPFTQLVCDVCHREERRNGSPADARLGAALEGWTFRDDAFEDVCPEHAPSADHKRPSVIDAQRDYGAAVAASAEQLDR